METEADANASSSSSPTSKVIDPTLNGKSAADCVQFKWHQEVAQYGDKLLQRLDEFRKKNMFYDVTLKAKDAELAAHKVVLAACGGMFRSHFVDPKTKMIAGDVTEVSLECPAAGLRPILKFAYSGYLEISHENVLPTLQAAITTEMKEVQEICSDIAVSKLGWLLSFDGTDESIHTGHKSTKHLPDDPDEVFEVLRLLLITNKPHFAHASSQRNEISEDDAKRSHPCYSKVREKFPDLAGTYLGVVDVLAKAKRLHRPKSTSAPPAKSDKPEKNGQHDTDAAHSPAGEVAGKKIVENGEGESDNAKIQSSGEKSKPSPPHPKERSSSGSRKKKADNHEVEERLKTAETEESKHPPRPKSKPRSVTAPPPSAAPHPHTDSKKARPPSPPKESPKQRALSQSAAGSPVPARKKPAAPRPPGPPPSTPLSRTPSAPPRVGKTPPPRPAGKVPPPRPRPPSVKKSESKPPPLVTNDYDDALNPFAIEEEDEEEVTEAEKTDKPTKSEEVDSRLADVKEGHKADEDAAETNDESLNPFD